MISVDTKKKELVGNFKNGGREWQPKGTPPAVLVHDFPSDAEGKAIPYGVYDMARNEAWVSVGRDHDTPAFAVASIRHWWQQMGCDAYPDATALFITADAGGSNGYRLRAWKHELQQLADETRLTIHVSHFPPGTSKWNKIEHRLFCHITANWRGTPLTTYETIVDRIGNTRTETGLLVRAELNAGEYPTGVTVAKEEMDAIALVRDEFHGEWNYKLLPRQLYIDQSLGYLRWCSPRLRVPSAATAFHSRKCAVISRLQRQYLPQSRIINRRDGLQQPSGPRCNPSGIDT